VLTDRCAIVVSCACASLGTAGGFAVRLFFVVLIALVGGAGLGYFGPGLVFAADKTELTFAAPDPDPKFVKPPRPGQSFGCDPLADANVFDDRFSRKATIWTRYEASKVAIQISDDGKRLSLMRATDVSAGVAQPEDFKITLNNNSYMQAEEQLTLGVALLIFDVRTMKMVWSFNGQGMLGLKGESVLFQCH
jgi:hypothetical protein